jgi:hypothetical protein
MQAEDPPESMNQKEKARWSISWARLLDTKVFIKANVPKNLSIISNNRVMCME